MKKHTVEFEFLLKKIKSRVEAREMQLYSDTTKLELLLENMKLEENADGLEELVAKSEILLQEIQLEQRVKGHIAKLKEHVDELKSLLKRKKSAHESLQSIQGQINMVQKSQEVLEFLTELDQRHIPKLEFLQDEIRLKQEEGQRSQVSEMDLKTHIAILELLVKDMESERDIESLETPTLKMQFERHLEKVTNLRRSMKFVREKGKLEFHTLTLKLREHIVEMNFILEKIKLSLTSGKQLKERMNELESFQEKIALVQLTGIMKSQTEKMESEQMEELGCRTLEVKLEQNVKNSESLLIKVESARDVVTLRPLTLRMELVEHSAKTESFCMMIN